MAVSPKTFRIDSIKEVGYRTYKLMEVDVVDKTTSVWAQDIYTEQIYRLRGGKFYWLNDYEDQWEEVKDDTDSYRHRACIELIKAYIADKVLL